MIKKLGIALGIFVVVYIAVTKILEKLDKEDYLEPVKNDDCPVYVESEGDDMTYRYKD